MQEVSAGFARLDQHIVSLTRAYNDRSLRRQAVHVRGGNPIHGHDVEAMALQRHQQVFSRRGVEPSPPLHLPRSHVQGRVGHAIGSKVEVAPPRRAIQPVGAPYPLLSRIICAERKGTKLFCLLIDKDHVAVQVRANDLKAHDDVFGRLHLR